MRRLWRKLKPTLVNDGFTDNAPDFARRVGLDPQTARQFQRIALADLARSGAAIRRYTESLKENK